MPSRRPFSRAASPISIWNRGRSDDPLRHAALHHSPAARFLCCLLTYKSTFRGLLECALPGGRLIAPHGACLPFPSPTELGGRQDQGYPQEVGHEQVENLDGDRS